MIEGVLIYGGLAVAGSTASIVLEKMQRQDLASTMSILTKGGLIIAFGYELFKLAGLFVVFL